jgi:hypothetical protein
MLKGAREKKSTTFLKKSDYKFGRFSSAQIATAIFVREFYALHSRSAPQGFSAYASKCSRALMGFAPHAPKKFEI